MLSFLNMFFTKVPPLQKKNSVKTLFYNSHQLDIYESLKNPLFCTIQLYKILNTNSSSEYITEYELYDLLFDTIDKTLASNFLKWLKTQLDYVQPVYEEIEKNGHIYVLKTDGGIKVGKTKNHVEKRLKNLQTGNINDIQILYDFHTSNHDLLEKVVHYILQRYRCNSNREFFTCNVEYIKHVINISGAVIDTLKSSFDSTSIDDILLKIDEKIKNEKEAGEDGNDGEDDVNFHDWLNTNVEYSEQGILFLDQVYTCFLNKSGVCRRLSPRTLKKLKYKYSLVFEKFVKEKYGDTVKYGENWWSNLKLQVSPVH